MSKSQLRLERDADGSFTCPDDPGEVGYVAGAKRVSVTEQEARLLSLLVHERAVLELGTGLGVATNALIDAQYQDGCVVTIDTDPWVQQNVHRALRNCVCLPSADLLRTHELFDVVFIDVHHDATAIAADVALAKKHLYKSGFLVFHGANYDHVLEAFAKHGAIDIIIPTKHGLGIMWAKELF